MGVELEPDQLTAPQRRPPHEGEASTARRVSGFAVDPQRRPPHEGEASRRPRRPGRLRRRPSTKASPRRGGEDSEISACLMNASPQRRPPHEGEARHSTRPSPPPFTTTLNEGLPTKGRRVTRAGWQDSMHAPLNEGLPTKGRRDAFLASVGSNIIPQRRPPHEGEARNSTNGKTWDDYHPQRRPPHEGEARWCVGV